MFVDRGTSDLWSSLGQRVPTMHLPTLSFWPGKALAPLPGARNSRWTLRRGYAEASSSSSFGATSSSSHCPRPCSQAAALSGLQMDDATGPCSSG